jgi:hypothetical protein
VVALVVEIEEAHAADAAEDHGHAAGGARQDLDDLADDADGVELIEVGVGRVLAQDADDEAAAGGLTRGGAGGLAAAIAARRTACMAGDCRLRSTGAVTPGRIETPRSGSSGSGPLAEIVAMRARD